MGYANTKNYISMMQSKDDRYGRFNEDEGDGVKAGSNVRSYISERMQHLADNGFDLGSSREFFERVSGAGEKDAGFANIGFFNNETERMGGGELRVMATAMMALEDMLSDGRLTADDYADYMRQLTSPGIVDQFESYDSNSVNDANNNKNAALYGLLTEINEQYDAVELGKMTPAEQAANKAANEESFKVEQHSIVNQRSDYVSDFEKRNPDGEVKYVAPLPTSPVANLTGTEPPDMRDESEKKDYDEHMYDRLDIMYESGIIDESTRDGMKAAVEESFEHGLSTNKKALIYAMDDVVAMNGKIDSKLMAKVMSPEFVTNMFKNDDATKADCIKTLSELNTAAYMRDVNTQVDSEEVQNGENEIADKRKYSRGSYNKMISDEELQQVHEDMYNQYFDDMGMDEDDIDALNDLLDAYDAANGDIDMTDEQREMVERCHDIDGFIDGVRNGSIFVSRSNEANQETGRYDYTARDFMPGKQLPENYASLLDDFNDAMAYVVDGTDTRETEDEGEGREEPEDGGEKEEDPEDSSEKEEENAGNTVVSPGEVEHDLDADLSMSDIAVLEQKSPMEEFEENLDLAQRMWRGDFGNGRENRVAAFAELGYSEEQYKQVQQMVNQGYEWCLNATAEDYDNVFNKDGASLAEQETAFRTQQAEAAARVLTYEGGSDLGGAYGNMIDEYNTGRDGQELTSDDIYGMAAGAYQDAGDDAKAGIGEDVLDEASGNLEAYVAGGEFETEGSSGSEPGADEGRESEGQEHVGPTCTEVPDGP